MANQPIIAPREDDANPFAPPQSDFSQRWSIGDSEAEALRRAHLKDESYVKALVIANLIYAVFCGAYLANRGRLVISHLSGRTRAPWILEPGHVAEQLIIAGMWICALGAACGFFRRKRWALRFEFLVALGFFLIWALEWLLRTEPVPIPANIGETILQLAFVVPILNVWHLGRSVIFDPEYTHALKATPHIKVWPKLSRKLVLIEVLLFMAAVILINLSEAL